MKQFSTDAVQSIFPCAVYIVRRFDNLITEKDEEEEIRTIIEEGVISSGDNCASISKNTHIFNDKLEKIKQFCEQHINIYIEQILSPKEELDFYITQSWLSIIKPGEHHPYHFHQNSILSGVFYIATEKTDNISFNDPLYKAKQMIKFETRGFNLWNSTSWSFPVERINLVLFPSWLEHGVEANENATTDRICLSFNTFTKGVFGSSDNLTELILK